MKTLLTLLQDNSGGLSSMRATMVAIIGYMLVSRIIAQITTGVVPPWSEEDKWIIGIVLAAKSHQRGKEQPEAAPDPTAVVSS